MKLIYGTGNKGKVKQVRDYIKTTNIDLDIVPVKELGFNKDIEENGTTFEENSLIKAKEIKKYCVENNIEGIIITDDSGICIEELDDRPGIYSARYAGDHAPQEIVLEKLLKEMKKVEEITGIKNRKAKYVCVITAILPNGKIIAVRGECKGTILEEPGELSRMTYDPVFVLEGFDKPVSEIEDKYLENMHREKAIVKLVEILKKEGY